MFIPLQWRGLAALTALSFASGPWLGRAGAGHEAGAHLGPISALLGTAELFDSPTAPEGLWGMAAWAGSKCLITRSFGSLLQQVLFWGLLNNYTPHTV